MEQPSLHGVALRTYLALVEAAIARSLMSVKLAKRLYLAALKASLDLFHRLAYQNGM